MMRYSLCALFGGLVGCLNTRSEFSLIMLVASSMAITITLGWLKLDIKARLKALTIYCLGIVMLSQKLSDILGVASTQQYHTALVELPELFVSVVIVPIVGITFVLLVQHISED